MSAGEALATVFELGCDYQDDFGENLKDDLVEVLHQLATDSHKYRAKKDRKQQRATFRDVLHYIESGEVPELQIKFGQECLILDSWVRRKQYDALCCILGPGINIHLSENDLLRDIFQLGTKILINDISIQRQTKLERVSSELGFNWYDLMGIWFVRCSIWWTQLLLKLGPSLGARTGINDQTSST